MKIHFFTIVLDGMPWITHHLPIFHKLPPEIQWDWTVVEGVADSIKDTAWCRKITPRVSQDGTHEYLHSLEGHPRFRHFWQPLWPGKVAMCNEALASMKEPGLLWEIDCDELWSEIQISSMFSLFDSGIDRNCADFFCRYFVGPNIVVDRIPGTWTNNFATMWRRVWRFEPGMQFASHEPPVIAGQDRMVIDQRGTEMRGCVFDHYAYVTEAQVMFKEEYYGYAGALEGWRRLQNNKQWPTLLCRFLPWVKDHTTARPLYQ